MQIKKLRFGGIGTFDGEVEVPIAELGDAKIVAVTGDNGAGKTTMLELVPGALYRSLPSRGALAALSTSRESFVELGIDVGGADLTAKIMINGTSKTRSTEAYLSSGGEPINDGKARTYDAEIERRLPSSETYRASAFAAQGGGDRFLALPPSKRKEMFVQMLGVGRLSRLAEAASERVAESVSRVNMCDAALAPVSRAEANRPALVGALERAEADRADAEMRILKAEEKARACAAELERWHERRAELTKDRSIADADVVKANTNRAQIERNLRRADDNLATLRFEISAMQERLAARPKFEQIVSMAAESDNKIADREARLAEIDSARVEHATALADWRAARAKAESEYREANAAWNLAKHTAQRDHAAAKDRVAVLSASAWLLSTVPCRQHDDCAGCALIASAVRARDAMPGARDALVAAIDAMADADIEPEHVTLAIAAGKALPPEPEAPRDHAERDRLIDEIDELKRAVRGSIDAREKIAALEEIERRLAVDVARASDLDGEIVAGRDALTAATEAYNAAREALRRSEMALAEHDSRRPEIVNGRELEIARASVGAAIAKAAAASKELALADEVINGAERLRDDLCAATAEMDDWTELAMALGKNGVQALEIDAAGPEVSSICNDLLHACYGSRFSVALETTAIKADGGTKETFDLRVIDTERGTDGSASQLSGGEQVMVSEALSLAICIYNARRSGVPMADLFRDECAGALTSENAVRYVEMLRKAVDLGGFHRVYFVAHQPHLWDLADARMHVSGGGVDIV